MSQTQSLYNPPYIHIVKSNDQSSKMQIQNYIIFHI